jgi:putative nucleotidyltransferase with HDIG domain
MMTINILSVLMILGGAIFLFLSFPPARHIWDNTSGQLRQKWLIILFLMGFFILGYLFFCIILISNMTFPVELVTGAVFLGGAFFVYIIVHISQRTIAALQTAEAATALARDDWKNTFDAATDMITVHDADFNIIRANPAARTLLGLQIQEELPLVKCFRCYHGTENPPSGCASCQSLVTGKPSTLEIFEPHLNRHLEIRAIPRFGSDHQLAGLIHVVRDITERKRSDEKLQRTLESLRKALGTTIQVLVSAVETRDPYTAGHQLRSADLARAIATEMGLPSENIEGIRIAGSIHDIGKLSIPAEILSKPTKLSEIEFALIKEHAHKGFEMLKDVESPWPLSEIVYQHHERMDGSGYPRNLKGEEILIEARILAVADVVEAMASHRPYRPGLGIDAALKEIEKNKGIFYDDAVADACLRLFREKGFKLEET